MPEVYSTLNKILSHNNLFSKFFNIFLALTIILNLWITSTNFQTKRIFWFYIGITILNPIKFLHQFNIWTQKLFDLQRKFPIKIVISKVLFCTSSEISCYIFGGTIFYDSHSYLYLDVSAQFLIINRKELIPSVFSNFFSVVFKYIELSLINVT